MDKVSELEKRIETLEARLDKLDNASSSEGKRGKMLMDKMNVGELSYAGKYSSPDGQIESVFGGDQSITNLLKINTKDMAQVIEAFASEERLDIVKLIIKQPLSAKEIMEILNFPTTGKVYHHLSFLEKLGIIKKFNEKYLISAKYVSCVVLIIAGVAEILRKQ